MLKYMCIKIFVIVLSPSQITLPNISVNVSSSLLVGDRVILTEVQEIPHAVKRFENAEGLLTLRLIDYNLGKGI